MKAAFDGVQSIKWFGCSMHDLNLAHKDGMSDLSLPLEFKQLVTCCKILQEIWVGDLSKTLI